MNNETKQEISNRAKHYMFSNDRSFQYLATATAVAEQDIRNILGGNFEGIATASFIMLANYTGYKLDEYWHTQRTRQFPEIIDALEMAKSTSGVRTIIGPTGIGKTFAVDKFVNKHSAHTYKITVSSLDRIEDILNKILALLGQEYRSSRSNKLRRVEAELHQVKRHGNTPTVIIDEAENLNQPALKMIKGLYDALVPHVGLVLIGTEDLVAKLERMKNKGEDGMPQLWRRLKATVVRVSHYRDFKLFYDKYNVEAGLRKLLDKICDNYGELHDYLEPALREADRRKEPLTEDLFRIIYNMPKFR